MNNVTEIYNILKLNGPTFYGASEDQARELASEWAEDFTADEAAQWIEAGFWCPSAAALVQSMDIGPRQIEGLCENIDHNDPVYALCNGDLDVSALEVKQ